MFSIIRLKNLLILLLALAIPLQGYAAAAMVFCGSENVTAARTAAATMHASSHHRADLQSAGLTSTSMQGDHHNGAHDKVSHSCSSCAACCIGVIPMPSTLAATQALAITHAIPFPLSGFVGYMPENPERPPSLLA
ncbi:hypothetical protein CAter282_1412 [Collimonas arenae]|uniref:DUF2946 domain-containing protein n=1 Tax=Collimonas arenae TaxID=279058 RepID=A0A127QGN2_9BURK|nr:hypothetical protein [Collimonas arenae]AMO99297.1 hypothetical protein CAter10_1531 [Collimonas arenae]AMP09201.1 hypothetical protein CAter282_1412 [Collimonas arenae]